MSKRQKVKGKKRPKSWHRGGVESSRARRAMKRWPETGVSAEAWGEPTPMRRNGTNRVAKP